MSDKLYVTSASLPYMYLLIYQQSSATDTQGIYVKGMSAIVHCHSKASKSYPSSSTRKAGSSQASRKYILFSFTNYYSCLHHRQQKQYRAGQVHGYKIVPGQLELCNLCVHPCRPTRLANQFRLTCYLIFLLTDPVRLPCFWYLHLPSPPTVCSCSSSNIDTQICAGSAGPAPVHARRYSDVTISYSGLGRQRYHRCLVILK